MIFATKLKYNQRNISETRFSEIKMMIMKKQLGQGKSVIKKGGKLNLN